MLLRIPFYIHQIDKVLVFVCNLFLKVKQTSIWQDKTFWVQLIEI